MERITDIKKQDVEKGFFIELECFVCGQDEIITFNTQKGLLLMVNNKGWRCVNSDMHQTNGHWCGYCSLIT